MKDIENRNYSFDILRIIACFLVIVNHTNSAVFIKYFPSLSGYMSLAYFFISKIAVPVFLMLTGSLLLNRKESLKTLFNKRILRVILSLLLFSIIMCLLKNRNQLGRINIKTFLISLISNPYDLSYWYLYMLIGIYICLPFIRSMVLNLTVKEHTYYLILWMVYFGVIPQLLKIFHLPTISGYFSLPTIVVPLGYILAGNYLSNIVDKEKIYRKRFLYIACVILILCISTNVVISIREYQKYSKFILSLDNYSTIFVMLQSISVYYIVCYCISRVRISEHFGKLLTSVSAATYGIYLTHIIIIQHTKYIINWLNIKMNDFIAVVLYEIIVFIIGYFITKIMKKIPYVKKLL